MNYIFLVVGSGILATSALTSQILHTLGTKKQNRCELEITAEVAERNLVSTGCVLRYEVRGSEILRRIHINKSGFSAGGSHGSNYTVGESVNIRCNPDNPQEIMLRDVPMGNPYKFCATLVLAIGVFNAIIQLIFSILL